MGTGKIDEIDSVPVTAIVTAYQRIEQTIDTIARIRACVPAPAEILVHVDGNQRACEQAIGKAYPDITIICSTESVGPGGGRNKLIAAAQYPLVASFDDDSYPLDKDYFARLIELFDLFPKASILGARIFHQGETIQAATSESQWVSDFGGGACAYRREDFLATSGYVPLPVAYGMEEVDLALRLHAQGGKILCTRWLRVFHNTDLKRHAEPEVTAASIANLALLAYLRYPPSLWIIGIGQISSRVLWLIRQDRLRGILAGLLMIPKHLYMNRQYRDLLTIATVKSYLGLKRFPVVASS